MSNGLTQDSGVLLRSNLKDGVAAHVRARIFSGEWRPGSKIDQDQLAARLGVSKLPVREALITLESEALIENVPRRGAFVAELTTTDVRDHYNVFGIVSGLAAERAAQRVTDDDVDRLRDLAVAMENSTSAEEQENLNFQFHRIINICGASRRLRAVLRLLGNSLPTRFFVAHPEWADIGHADHRAIVSALERRDAAAAREAVERHLRDSADLAVTILSERGFWPASDE